MAARHRTWRETRGRLHSHLYSSWWTTSCKTLQPALCCCGDTVSTAACGPAWHTKRLSLNNQTDTNLVHAFTWRAAPHLMIKHLHPMWWRSSDALQSSMHLPHQIGYHALTCPHVHPPPPAVIPARQPHLLDGTGSINSQLLERGSTPLVFTSLVLKTSLGSFIQVGGHRAEQP